MTIRRGIFQGEKEKILNLILPCGGWKVLFHIYRLSHKGIIVNTKILAKELGLIKLTNNDIIRSFEKMGLIVRTKINNPEATMTTMNKWIYQIQLTPYGNDIASYIYNLVKYISKNTKEENITEENITATESPGVITI